jgi:hypothetical protein
MGDMGVKSPRRTSLFALASLLLHTHAVVHGQGGQAWLPYYEPYMDRVHGCLIMSTWARLKDLFESTRNNSYLLKLFLMILNNPARACANYYPTIDNYINPTY